MFKIDLDIISDVKFVCKFVKSMIKMSNKVNKLKTQDEIINNLIYENRWHKAIAQNFF